MELGELSGVELSGVEPVELSGVEQVELYDDPPKKHTYRDACK